MNKELIQLINIIRYRLDKCINDVDKNFFEFNLGKGSRSPNEILSHLVDVSNYGLQIIDGPRSPNREGSHLKGIIENLNLMKSIFTEVNIDDETSRRLINGPLSDTLTHIGQLAFLRRLQGSPIAHENFSKAAI